MARVSRGSDQFPVRLPDGMRDEIKAAAKTNGRSMNSEILARLDGPQTLRDWFAGQALTGLLASIHGQGLYDFALDAKEAYQIADAMLKAREAS